MVNKLSKKISGFEYPEAYRKLQELNLLDFDLWYIMKEEHVLNRLASLRERYPNRYLIPFAKRDDNDDIACFDISQPNKVQVIYDFATAGYEQRNTYDDLWEWLEEAVKEMIERNRFEEKRSGLDELC